MTQLNEIKLKDIKLNTLNPGEHGVIQAIHAEHALHQRLNALGFRIGKKIELIRRASFNGPLHVRIGATDIIMRDVEAQRIQLNAT
jgi:ferrous iron transport protein A